MERVWVRNKGEFEFTELELAWSNCNCRFVKALSDISLSASTRSICILSLYFFSKSFKLHEERNLVRRARICLCSTRCGRHHINNLQIKSYVLNSLFPLVTLIVVLGKKPLSKPSKPRYIENYIYRVCSRYRIFLTTNCTLGSREQLVDYCWKQTCQYITYILTQTRTQSLLTCFFGEQRKGWMQRQIKAREVSWEGSKLYFFRSYDTSRNLLNSIQSSFPNNTWTGYKSELDVPFWCALKPCFVSWRDAVEPKYPWRDQTRLLRYRPSVPLSYVRT